jgi:integrase
VPTRLVKLNHRPPVLADADRLGEVGEHGLEHFFAHGVCDIPHRAAGSRLDEAKRDADAYHATVRIEVGRGIHTAERRSVTVAKAGELWVNAAVNAGLERSTLEQYQAHLKLHIAPLIGGVKLSQLTVPAIRAFEDQLAKDRSPAMVRKILRSLSGIVAYAQERGVVSQNAVRSLRRRPTSAEARQKGKLKVGVDIPAPNEIAALVAHLKGPMRPLLMTAILTGLRASELRGLRWADIDLKRAVLHVRQRADRWHQIGRPKSAAGERTVPIPPLLVNTLREHKLTNPHDLAFANPDGNPFALPTIIKHYHQAQAAAGLTNAKGKVKYGGLHALRHFYASWLINAKKDGGLELPLKIVSARLGHASISITADVYGHLFASKDDGGELAAAEQRLLG